MRPTWVGLSLETCLIHENVAESKKGKVHTIEISLSPGTSKEDGSDSHSSSSSSSSSNAMRLRFAILSSADSWLASSSSAFESRSLDGAERLGACLRTAAPFLALFSLSEASKSS